MLARRAARCPRAAATRPVDVSACTSATSFGRSACDERRLDLLGADRRAAPRRLDAVGRAPARSATSAMRVPKTPFTPTTTSSPGSSRFTRHASMPALPVPEIGKRERVLGARRPRAAAASPPPSCATNAGSRWPTSGARHARAARAGGPRTVRDRGAGARAARTRRDGGLHRRGVRTTTPELLLQIVAMSMRRAARRRSSARSSARRRGRPAPRRSRSTSATATRSSARAPELVVLPRSTGRGERRRPRLPPRMTCAFVPRGAGTGLSGGTLARRRRRS